MPDLTYVVLGAGRQGLAAAFDFARHGDARRVLLADRDEQLACAAARRLDDLAGRPVGEPLRLDADDDDALLRILEPADAVLSALPYPLNPRVARIATRAATHFVDLGGNTAVSARVLELDAAAREAGVTLVPDCGVAPGLAATFAALLMDTSEGMEEPEALHLRCGGLPQRPRGPLDYQLSFSIGGLTNEYLGEAEVLRDGARRRVPTLAELEEIDLPAPLGRCEAFITSGGTSTLPRTYAGRLRELDYKTVRWPGHCDKIRAMRDLGLLSDEPVDVEGGRVRPRDVFETVAAPRLQGTGPDLLVLRVEAVGRHGGRPSRRRLDVLDVQDETTGFTAMQRMTGFPAAMVAESLARGEARPGATPVELVLPPRPLVEGLADRGIGVRDESFES